MGEFRMVVPCATPTVLPSAACSTRFAAGSTGSGRPILPSSRPRVPWSSTSVRSINVERDGALPGAVIIDRNVLEWRLDPTSAHRLPLLDDPEQRIVLVCNEGYSSSLAAHTLQLLGLPNATDLCGGYQAWALFHRQAVSTRP